MAYSIFVFNQIEPGQLMASSLQSALEKASFSTLCEQYGLTQDLIAPTLQNLKVVGGFEDISPYFIVNYRPQGKRPIFVYRWEPSQDQFSHAKQNLALSPKKEILDLYKQQTRSIFQIYLYSEQLMDMGLLLGYEIVRWLGVQSTGIVRDLVGNWFRINQHQAFVPIE